MRAHGKHVENMMFLSTKSASNNTLISTKEEIHLQSEADDESIFGRPAQGSEATVKLHIISIIMRHKSTSSYVPTVQITQLVSNPLSKSITAPLSRPIFSNKTPRNIHSVHQQ